MVFLLKPPPPRKSSRSHGVIPRSMSEKQWMIPISTCDPNVMLLVGWHWLVLCQGQRSCRAKNRKKPRVKTFIYDFSQLHHSNPNSFGANVHLHQHFLKTVKVIEWSRDVIQRSKYEISKGPLKSPCALRCNSDHYFWSYGILKKNGACYFS